jgi:hypothetical protein
MRGLLHVTELILGVNFLLFIAAAFGKCGRVFTLERNRG